MESETCLLCKITILEKKSHPFYNNNTYLCISYWLSAGLESSHDLPESHIGEIITEIDSDIHWLHLKPLLPSLCQQTQLILPKNTTMCS